MSGREVTVAVLSDGALRAYHRNGAALAQVAQLVVGTDVEPEVIATMMADMGDVLGWGPVGGRQVPSSMAAGRVRGALPAGQPPRRDGRGRRPSGDVEAERQRVLDAIVAQPGIRRAEVADQLGVDLGRVKRRSDELLASGQIDARPLPGVRERGPGGGHGLYPVTDQGGATP